MNKLDPVHLTFHLIIFKIDLFLKIFFADEIFLDIH